ncbi:hypothetical protein [Nonomuraea typhae]|uniref:Inhibitor I9 domain-containing protein n=1 Tax=Nonomuraea typhae TaxID=2603600 RepID=A0ABW7YWF6_9ACTN
MRVIVLAFAALALSWSCAQPPSGTRVVVTLEVPLSAPADPGDALAERRYAKAIADAQDQLLQELRPYDTQLLTRYRNLPQLALVVDPAALRHLRESPLVTAVQEDTPGSPPS